MRTTNKTISLFLLAALAMLSACNGFEKCYEKANTLYNNGCEARQAKNTEEAAEKFTEALLILQQCKPQTDEKVVMLRSELQDNLGAMYWKHGLFEAALAEHQQAVEGFRSLADEPKLTAALRNCGRVATSLGDFEQGKAYYDSAFVLAEKTNDKALLGDLHLEIGRDYYMNIGEFEKGIEEVAKALEMLQNQPDADNDIDICHMTLGILHYYTNEYETAKTHLEKALRSERAGLRMSCYQTLYAISNNMGDLNQALEYQDLFIENMMQSEAEQNTEAMQRIKAEYELKMQKAEMNAIHRVHDFKLYLLIAGIVILLLVILLIVRKKIADHRIEMEQFKGQVERDQNRIHELVSDMENLIRTNDELRKDRQTLSQKELLMTSQILLRNKVYATAKSLTEEVTTESLNFTLSEDDWADFIGLTDLVYDGFSQRLLGLYPKLSKWDVRICCLSKQNFSNQVISILLDTQTDSYYRRKVRIKQMKMDMTNDTRSFEEIVNAV